jgi:hypothetical protein
MSFQITPQLRSIEDFRWNRLNDLSLRLEKHLRKVDHFNVVKNRINRNLFWLMDALNKYNIRRRKLFYCFVETELTENDWIEFDHDMEKIESLIIKSFPENQISEDLLSEDLLQKVKELFWLMDGFVRFKLKNCKSYMVKNNLKCDINDSDLSENLEDAQNPFFSPPTEFKVNRETFTRLVGTEVSEKISDEAMNEISENARTLKDLQVATEENLEEKIDLTPVIFSSSSVDLSADITPNSEEIFIEAKVQNPIEIKDNENKNKNVNVFIKRNPLMDLNDFLKKNPLFKNKRTKLPGNPKIKPSDYMDNIHKNHLYRKQIKIYRNVTDKTKRKIDEFNKTKNSEKNEEENITKNEIKLLKYNETDLKPNKNDESITHNEINHETEHIINCDINDLYRMYQEIEMILGLDISIIENAVKNVMLDTKEIGEDSLMEKIMNHLVEIEVDKPTAPDGNCLNGGSQNFDSS